MEVWKDISCYVGLYQISNLGRVRSLTRFVRNSPTNSLKKVTTQILALQVNAKGYTHVMLHKTGKSKRFYVHRLVAEAFILKQNGKPEVNHKNGIKHDNRAKNLEWCSRSENLKHKYDVLGWKTPKRGNSKRARPVVQLKDGVVVARYACIRDAIDATGCRSISQICQGKPHYKTGHGYEWKYA